MSRGGCVFESEGVWCGSIECAGRTRNRIMTRADAYEFGDVE